jgi:phenylacetate-CoA ligase
MVVTDAPADRHPAIAGTVAERLRERLGVRIGVELVAPGALDALTGQDRAKAKRFLDRRQR